jgi:hypothetical protein
MKAVTVLAVAGVSLALTACNRPDANRTTSIPAGINDATTVTAPIVTRSAPPAPAERGPIPANANAEAPGTNASVAFADSAQGAGTKLPASKGGAPEEQAAHAKAQDDAAKAADTAAGDAAKKAGLTSGPAAGGARDSTANNPRAGSLTKSEESSQMPKAGQANNHSSPALDTKGTQ